MKIAIAAPCPQPFAITSAERLWWALARQINEATPHQSDVIKLPVSEVTFWSMLDGYRRFSRLDLSGFDVVITGRHPAWMISHPGHVVYMLRPVHELNHDHDVATFADVRPDDEMRGLVEFLRLRDRQRNNLDAVFDRLEMVRELERKRGVSLIAWPGPVAREVVRWLDAVGLSRDSVTRYVAVAEGLNPEFADWQPVLAALLPTRAESPPPGHPDFKTRAVNEGVLAGRVEQAISVMTPAQRRVSKARLGVERPVVLAIVGARNGTLLQDLCFVARALPEVLFILPDVDVDDVGLASLPPNVAVPGRASGSAHEIIEEVADAAIFLSERSSALPRSLVRCVRRGIPILTTGATLALPAELGPTAISLHDIQELPAALAAFLRSLVEEHTA